MRKLVVVGSLLGITLPLAAIAQPPPPPPPPPSGTGMAPMAPAAEPAMRFDVGLGAGLPEGDFEGVDTSPVLTLIFGATVAPNVSVFGGLRYISIQPDGDSGGVDFSQYDLLAGGRYAFPVSPTARVFAEGFLTYSTLSVSFNGESDSESGIGFGLRGGAVFTVSGNIGIGGALGFSTASIDVEGGSVDAAWLTPEVFASFGF